MSEQKDEVVVTLETPIEYKPEDSGEVEKAYEVTIYAPSSKQLKNTVYLKQCFFRALNSVSDTDAKEKDVDKDKIIEASDVMALLYMSDIDMHKFMLSARELFQAGVAKIDGKRDFTVPLLDKLSPDDLETLAGEYLINFILASALKKINSLK